MKKKYKRGLLFLFLCFLLIGITGTKTVTEGEEKPVTISREQTLVIGRVSDNPRKHYKRLKPIVDYVAGHMKDLGIRQGSVLMAKNNQELIQYLNEGRVDWLTETIFSAIVFSDKAGAEIMLRRWKQGAPDYYSVFFARKNSGINSLEDLKGKKIAFEDPGSATAYFMPVHVLEKAGLNLVELSSPRIDPPADKIGYVFAGAELNISIWVHKGLADAGAFSNLDWEDDLDTLIAFKKDLKIIYKTGSFPRALELVRGNLDPKIKKRLKHVLMIAHNDAEAKEALNAYSKTIKFDEIKGGVKAELEDVRRNFKYIQKYLK